MKQSSKRFASLTAAFALVVAALIVYFNLIQPAYEDGQAVKAQMLARKDFVDSQKAAIDQARKLIASYKGKGDFQKVVSQVFPLDPDLAGAFAQLNGIVRINRLAPQSATVSIPALQSAVQNAPGASAAVEAKPLGSITLQVRLLGTYEDFKSFLKNLESNIRMFDAEKIGIQLAGKPNQDLYIYDLTLTTYYQGQ